MLLADQAIKWLIRERLEIGQDIPFPWPGVFELTLTYNKGIAFGMFQGRGFLFAPMAILISAWAAVYCFRSPREPKIVHIACGLLSAGALGNLIDRLWLGHVTDMFWLRIINFPVFNVADVCITFGAILMGIRLLFEPKGSENPQKEPITNT